MSGALSIVDTAPAIQGQSCNLCRLLSPLLQMEFYVDIQTLQVLGEPERKTGIPLLGRSVEFKGRHFAKWKSTCP